MGADYNEVFRRLYNEAMIRKFVLLFPKDDSFHNLEAALKEQNVKEAFRAAHTLKGVCQNLGFSNLYAPAVTLPPRPRAWVRLLLPPWRMPSWLATPPTWTL